MNNETGLLLERKDVLLRIAKAKERLGHDLLLLAHFYQNDDIVRLADFVGDSLALAEKASRHQEARYIVFCSVSFMAETARILCRPDQEVLHPEPASKCPLADMASLEGVEAAWRALSTLGKEIIPVVYVNSNADLKAFCGRHNGTVCTSANVKRIFSHVLTRGASVFFFPDENMGRNIAGDLGLQGADVYRWDPEKGLAKEAAREAKVFLWEGFCIVHRLMKGRDVVSLRNKHDGIKVIVHPECTPEVYGLADLAGSTNVIKKTVDASEAGSKWAIGTEWNFVDRIRRENPDKMVIPLREEWCKEMAKVTPERLLRVLEGLLRGELVNRVTVDEAVSKEARTALGRMLEIG
ncbi:MAG: quinolinate synthase NadA [Syntrophorhabdales bacterium]|jgi:quinolinate synthase